MNNIKEIYDSINTLETTGQLSAYAELESALKNALVREAKSLIRKRGCGYNDGTHRLESKNSFVPVPLSEIVCSDSMWNFIAKANKLSEEQLEEQILGFAVTGILIRDGAVYLTDEYDDTPTLKLSDLPIDAIIHILSNLKLQIPEATEAN